MSIHSTLEDLKQKCIHQNCKTMASKLVKLLPLASRSITLGPRNALLNFTLRRNYLPRRYDPFDDMRQSVERMFSEFDRMFTSPFFYRPAIFSRSTSLPIESYDSEKGLLKIELDLSGFKPEDIQVTIKDGQLEIAARSESTGDIKERRELHYSYALSKNADIEKVKSLLKSDGRLVIEAPLSPEDAKKPAQRVDTEIPVKKIE